MKNKSAFLIFLIVCLSFLSVMAEETPVDEGKNIFATRCASCHNINKTLTGPALAGIDERRSLDWIINFVHSSQEMIKSGDAQAVALYDQFNKIPMPDHKDLNKEKIENIIAYIKSETKTSEAITIRKPGKLRPDYKPLSLGDYHFFIGFLIVVGLLIASLLISVHLHHIKKNSI